MLSMVGLAQPVTMGVVGGMSICGILPRTPVCTAAIRGSYGLSFNYDGIKHLSLSIGLEDDRKGFQSYYIHDGNFFDPEPGIFADVFTFNYLSVPLGLNLRFGNHIYYLFGIGISPELHMNAFDNRVVSVNQTAQIPVYGRLEIHDATKFDLSEFNNFTIGKRLSKRLSAEFAMKYQVSLRSISNKQYLSMLNLRSHLLNLSVGLRIKIFSG